MHTDSGIWPAYHLELLINDVDKWVTVQFRILFWFCFWTEFAFVEHETLLVPAMLLKGLFCNIFKASKAFKPKAWSLSAVMLVLLFYGSDKIYFVSFHVVFIYLKLKWN